MNGNITKIRRTRDFDIFDRPFGVDHSNSQPMGRGAFLFEHASIERVESPTDGRLDISTFRGGHNRGRNPRICNHGMERVFAKHTGRNTIEPPAFHVLLHLRNNFSPLPGSRENE